MAHPSFALIAQVAAMHDPVARNFAITQCYRDLASAVGEVVGRRDVNWLAFGSWASGTAGMAIRGEGLLVDWGTSAAVAEGNRTIIADIGPPFVRWLDEIERAGRPSRSALDVALGDRLFDSAPDLRLAFTAYQTALQLAVGNGAGFDPAVDRAVAELVLLGNVRVAAHEQQIADSLIDRAMPLGGLFGLITTRFVHMVTPDGPIDVCEDVPAPSYLRGSSYPDALDHLANTELCELARRFHHEVGVDVSGSGAATWESFDERMGYIFAFFRAFARDPRFFEVPDSFLSPPTPRRSSTRTDYRGGGESQDAGSRSQR
ncbi:MAG: hypothetical protein WBP09_11895 [Propionicimonas sp.]